MNAWQQLQESTGGKSVLFDPSGFKAPLLEDACWMEILPDDLQEEKKDGDTRFYLNGRIGLVETATANRRVYSKKIMSREIGRLKENMKARRVYGTCDHPKDGRTLLEDVSHYIVDAEINENNEIIGKLEIIPESIMGKQILAIARTGGQLGVSSRGFGSVSSDNNGNHVVQEDYRLVTWDIVADPANAGAYPSFVAENKEIQEPFMDIETLKKEHPELVESLKEAIRAELAPESREHARVTLKEEFENKLKEAGVAIRDQVTEEVKKELLQDPEVAAAKEVVESIKGLVRPYLFSEDENAEIHRLQERVTVLEWRIAEQDTTILEQQEDNDKLASAARKLACHLYLEHELETPFTPQDILSRIGDLDRFDSIESFKTAVKSIQESMGEEIKASQEKEAALQEMKDEVARLREERDKALAIGNQGFIRAYLEKQIGRHPRAAKVREYVLEAAPVTQDKVDELIRAYDADNPVSEEFSRISRGLQRSPKTEDNNERSLNEDTEESTVFGVPMSQVRGSL
jgi:hypothetical protein